MGNRTLYGLVLVSIAGTGASNYYLYNRIQALQTSTPAPATASLDPIAIVQLVDERLAARQKRQAEEQLGRIKTQYANAGAQTVDNKLLYGNANARIQLIEWGDYECPYCRKLHASLKQVIDHSEGVINWEFKHFPLASHNPVAANEALAIECINANYDNTTAWVMMDRFIQDTKGNGRGFGDLVDYVREAGLNGSLINNCLAGYTLQQKINEDYRQGRQLGITATPAILIKDTASGTQALVKGYKSPEEIVQAIQAVMDKTSNHRQ
jgi:protein-disulfide isomerase